MIFDACSKKPVSSSEGPLELTAAGKIQFEKKIQPIFTLHCIACHAPGANEDGSAMGGMILATGKAAANLVGVKSIESSLMRVAPGDPQKSYLYHKIRGTQLTVGGVGAQMPLGLPPLTKEEIGSIESWISSGASTK